MSHPRHERSDGFWLSAAPETGLQRVVTSAEVRDRNDRLVIQDGWDLSNYSANPIVLWAHDASRLPIGAAENVHVASHDGTPALMSDLRFFEPDVDQFAAKVGRLMAAGELRGVSAGWIGLETQAAFETAGEDEQGDYIGTDFIRSELVEQSVVPVPANPAALRAALDLELHREELEVVFSDYTPANPVTVDLKPPGITSKFRARKAANDARDSARKELGL